MTSPGQCFVRTNPIIWLQLQRRLTTTATKTSRLRFKRTVVPTLRPFSSSSSSFASTDLQIRAFLEHDSSSAISTAAAGTSTTTWTALYNSKSSSSSSSSSPEYQLTRTAVRRMRVADLRQELTLRGLELPTGGNREQLVKALLSALEKQQQQQQQQQQQENSTTMKRSTKSKRNTLSLSSSKDVSWNTTTMTNTNTTHTNSTTNPTTTTTTNTTEIDPTRTYTLRLKGIPNKKSNGTGIGIVLRDANTNDETNNCVWMARKYFPKSRTIYEAEYTALILALKFAHQKGVRNVIVQIDQQVLFNHLNGKYPVEKETLKPMYWQVMKFKEEDTEQFTLEFISKLDNVQSEELAYKALATGVSLNYFENNNNYDSDNDVVFVTEDPMSVLHQNHHHDDIEEEQQQQQQQQQQKHQQQQQQQQQSTLDVNNNKNNNHKSTRTVSPLDPIHIVKEEDDDDHYHDYSEKNNAPPSPPAISNNNNNNAPPTTKIYPSETYLLQFDGGARGNPSGKAGAGMVLYDSYGQEIWCGWKFLGSRMSNNQAEYYALFLGLQCAKSLGIERIRCEGDSDLIIKQLKGIYQVRNPGLKKLWKSTKEVIDKFQHCELHHVYRENNKRADWLANNAMDQQNAHGFEELLLDQTTIETSP